MSTTDVTEKKYSKYFTNTPKVTIKKFTLIKNGVLPNILFAMYLYA